MKQRMRATDIATPWGFAREVHIAAAYTLYGTLIKRQISTDLALVSACHLQDVSPAAASLLEFWIRTIHLDRGSWADLSE